mmetsp:Transcript_81063/g.262660  ORF Transcript_81063/g.262660 Transcript_81063/m.262660 type:complete len:309 (-) Transcript_81063:655-1581(-)
MTAIPPQEVVLAAQILPLQLLREPVHLVLRERRWGQLHRLPEVVLRVGPWVHARNPGVRLARGVAEGPFHVADLHGGVEDTAQLDGRTPVRKERVQPPDARLLRDVVDVEADGQPRRRQLGQGLGQGLSQGLGQSVRRWCDVQGDHRSVNVPHIEVHWWLLRLRWSAHQWGARLDGRLLPAGSCPGTRGTPREPLLQPCVCGARAPPASSPVHGPGKGLRQALMWAPRRGKGHPLRGRGRIRGCAEELRRLQASPQRLPVPVQHARSTPVLLQVQHQRARGHERARRAHSRRLRLHLQLLPSGGQRGH